MNFKMPMPSHEKAADEIMLAASNPRWQDISQLSGAALVTQALMRDRKTGQPKQASEREALRKALVIGLANGWENDPVEAFAAKIGGVAGYIRQDTFLLKQTGLRATEPEKVDYAGILGIPPQDDEGRKWVENELDGMLADRAGTRERIAISEGRLHDASPERQEEMWAQVTNAEKPVRWGYEAVFAVRETVTMIREIEEDAERLRIRANPLPLFEEKMVEAAKKAIVKVANQVEVQELPNDQSRHSAERSAMIGEAMFHGENAFLYNTALHQRTGMPPPDMKLQEGFAEYGVPMLPTEDNEWRAEAMVKARRELQLEGIPPRLQPEETRQAHNVPLPITSTYNQQDMQTTLERAAKELGVTPAMMSTPGEMAPLARVMHLHAPHALAIARHGSTQQPGRASSGEAVLHADTIEHMTRADFDQARYDLARAKVTASWMAPTCSQSTRELLGTQRGDGQSQIEAIFVEAERRVAPPEQDRPRGIGARIAASQAMGRTVFG